MIQLGFALLPVSSLLCGALFFHHRFESISALLSAGPALHPASDVGEQADNEGHMQMNCKYAIPLIKQFTFNTAHGAARHLASSAKVVFSVLSGVIYGES